MNEEFSNNLVLEQKYSAFVFCISAVQAFELCYSSSKVRVFACVGSQCLTSVTSRSIYSGMLYVLDSLNNE